MKAITAGKLCCSPANWDIAFRIRPRVAFGSGHHYPGQLTLPSMHFVALIAMDARTNSTYDLFEFGKTLLRQGAVYLCTWGPDSERVHDIFDEASQEVLPEETDETVIMTTWHDSESLAEALYFGLRTTFPGRAYEPRCGTLLVVTIGNAAWSEQVDKWLADPEGSTAAVEAAGRVERGA